MMPPPPMSTPIEDYALIGDCRSAALVSRGGSIDFLCWPRFDSPAIFCALLDPESGGAFRIAPVESSTTERTYRGETAVLRTTFTTETGIFELTDAMLVTTDEERHRALTPEHEIVRVMTCVEGHGHVALHYAPRPHFGTVGCSLADRGALGLRLSTRAGLLTLRTDTNLRLAGDHRSAEARRLLIAGESLHCSLTWAADGPAVLEPLGEPTVDKLTRTEATWLQWSARTTYGGPYSALVKRSAVVLRMLAYAPSGAIVAAVTTSLPEVRGGANNWDYRFCWLRDAAFTVRGLLALGHPEEADAFVRWLLHATRLTQPKLMVLYDVYGREPKGETSVTGLRGYGGALPVRTGNGAANQVQLDSYGEVVDAAWRLAVASGVLSRGAAKVLERMGGYVCDHWREPDAGIWEPRDEPQLHTHSLALAWVALDRLIDLQARGLMRTRGRARFADARASIRREIDARGYNDELGSYVSVLDGDELDATALLLGLYGFDDPASERMRSTHARLVERLSPAPGLVFRNAELGDDGAFGICSFWLADHLAQGGGTLAEARAAFEATAAYANDVGLFAEQIEPGSGAALGNTPQTFTHVGLINAALSIMERLRKEQAAS